MLGDRRRCFVITTKADFKKVAQWFSAGLKKYFIGFEVLENGEI